MEYGDINYTIHAPADMLLLGSGELLNAREVLTAAEYALFNKAKSSDNTIVIHRPSHQKNEHMSSAEVEQNRSSQPGNEKTSFEKSNLVKNGNGKGKNLVDGTSYKTWKFKCNDTRDVAFAASAAFIWDAARINLPGGKHSLAMSAYPEESAGDSAWKMSTQMLKAAIEFYSTYTVPFTYPSASNIAGIATGMEYPGIVFCGKDLKAASLWETTSHEFGHNWFPMLVGSNEREFAWMDEGFNTFINSLADQSCFGGAWYNKLDIAGQAKYLFYDFLPPIMTAPDKQPTYFLGQLAYNKPSIGLQLLREQILGKERFDQAFKTYTRKWTYKHPTPYDFFHCMENSSGEKLDWFWRGWFFNNWKIDQAITKINYVEGKGTYITIISKEQLPMPVTMDIKTESRPTESNNTQSGNTASNRTTRIQLPVEIWASTNEWVYLFDSPDHVTQVTLDPDLALPDTNRKNNILSN